MRTMGESVMRPVSSSALALAVSEAAAVGTARQGVALPVPPAVALEVSSEAALAVAGPSLSAFPVSPAVALEVSGVALLGTTPELVITRDDGVKVHLIGTCHLSSDSAAYTAARIRELRPRTVIVELCEERRPMLSRPPATRTDEGDTSVGGVGSSVGGVLADWTELIGLMYHSFEALIDRQTGAEFIAAVQAARECGARVVLGDRLSSQTLGRLRRMVTLKELVVDMQLLHADFAAQQSIERTKLLEECITESAAVSSLARAIARGEPVEPERARELERRAREIELTAARAHRASVSDAVDGVMWRLLVKFWRRELIDDADKDLVRWAIDSTSLLDPLTDCLPPTFKKVLVAERDHVLAAALARAEGPTVVGVVGAAHMSGITRAFAERALPSEAELASYREVPPWQPKPWHGVAGLLTGGLVVGSVRSPAFRRTLGVATLGAGVGAAWLVSELRERVRFFQSSQRALGGLRAD